MSERISPFKFTIVRFIILFSVLIVTVNTVIIIYRGVNRYHKEINAKKEEIESTTRAIGDHMKSTFLAVDVVLQRAVDKHRSNLLFGSSQNLQQDTQNNIISWIDQSPQIAAMLMTNEYGEIKAIYRKQGYKLWMEGKEFVSQEEYFKYHVDEIDQLYIGRQPSFIKNQKGFIVLSRRLDKIDGTFDGIILAAVNIDYVISFFNSIEKDSMTKLVITHHPDGMKIYDPFMGNESAESKQFDDNFIYSHEFSERAKSENPKVTITKATGIVDNKLRIYSFLTMRDIQMQVSLIFHGNDILRNWNSERLSDAILYIIFLLFVLVVAFFSIELAKQVSKLRASEKKALAASKAKSDFLANMSHELRTPLNAIIGFSEMLMTEYFGKINDKQRERLKDIHGCGNHLLSLINDILEFSKGQAGKLEIRPEEVAIHRVVNEVVRMFDERAKNDGIIITVNASKSLPYIFVDKRKIKQILINLISNAVKFSEKGDVINVSAKVNDNEEFVLSVKDSGIGMREEDIPKALSAFGQVHKDRAIAGTGLGLPLCKLFAELHNGTLDIRSKLGAGTEVTVILPRKVIIKEKVEV
jgi:signal transduction histidine kinase